MVSKLKAAELEKVQGGRLPQGGAVRLSGSGSTSSENGQSGSEPSLAPASSGE